MTGDIAGLLARCDHILGELGRREHRFSWLRPPDAAADGWLAIDAYYPANRLVVICRSEPAAPGDLYSELIPRRGLRLLELMPSELPSEPAARMDELRRLIAELGPAPERARETPLEDQRVRDVSLTEAVLARVLAAFTLDPPLATVTPRRVGVSQTAAAQRAARFVAARQAQAQARPPAPTQPRMPARGLGSQAAAIAARSARRQPTELQPLGVALGLAVVGVVLFEAYLGVARLGLDGGRLLLAFGLALDACARVLGAAAAGGARQPDWAWWCALGGSPAVAAFTLFGREGPVRVDPAPLGGLVSLLAMLTIGISLLAALLGL